MSFNESMHYLQPSCINATAHCKHTRPHTLLMLQVALRIGAFQICELLLRDKRDALCLTILRVMQRSYLRDLIRSSPSDAVSVVYVMHADVAPLPWC
jgi:hypothetical protein